MKFFNKNRIKIGVFILGITFVAYPVFATAGSNEDPIISLSYFNQRVALLNDTLIEKIENLDKKIESIDINQSGTNDISQGYPKFTVLALKTGDQLFLSESTEVIMRSGDAYSIANEYGDGLADVTSGKDLKQGEKLIRNHLLITPREDGRGIKCQSEVFVMVKGNYKLLQ